MKFKIKVLFTALFILGGLSITAYGNFSEALHSTPNGKWKASYMYPDTITVLRIAGENKTITLNPTYYFLGWYNAYSNRNQSKRYRYSVEMEGWSTGISVSLKNARADSSSYYYEVSNFIPGSDSVEIRIKELRNSTSKDRGKGVGGEVEISVPSDVLDGTYELSTTLKMGNRTDTSYTQIIVKTLPEVWVDDIDFGAHPADAVLDLQETSQIIIIGGTPYADYTLSTKDIELVSPGNSQTIPVKLSVVTDSGSSRGTLNYWGNGSGVLKAEIEDVKVSEPGTYSGTATIIFNYN